MSTPTAPHPPIKKTDFQRLHFAVQLPTLSVHQPQLDCKGSEATVRERGPENRRPFVAPLLHRTAKRNIQAANRNEDSYGQEHHAARGHAPGRRTVSSTFVMHD